MKIGQIEIKRLWSGETFLLSVCVILAVTAGAKLVSAWGGAPILDRPDSLVAFLSLREMMLMAAFLELAFAGWILVGKPFMARKLKGVIWLGLVLVLYRTGAAVAGDESSCPCLGEMTDALNISASTAAWSMRGLLAYMLIPACVLCWIEDNQSHGGVKASVPSDSDEVDLSFLDEQ